MREVTCVFNSVNGNNTGFYMRRGPAYSHAEAGILLKHQCPNGTFYVDGDDGADPYYRLLYPERYGLDATPRYAMCKMTWLSSMTWGTSSGSSGVDPNLAVAEANASAYSKGLDDAIVNMLMNTEILDDIANNWRVSGAPFQFMEHVDYRPFKKYPIGRTYASNIVAEAPLVTFVPGTPSYLPDVTNKERIALENFMEARYSGKDVSSNILKKISSIEGRYFDFNANFGEYTKYVNALCRTSSVYMGIGDKTVEGTNVKYKNFDWSEYDNMAANTTYARKYAGGSSVWNDIKDTGSKLVDSFYNEIFGDFRTVKLYVDPSSSFNESISNNTSQSQIGGLFDTTEGLAKELQMIMGGDGSMDLGAKLADGIKEGFEKIGDTLGTSGTTNLQKLLGLSSNVLAGSNVIFPEVWGDSSFSKSYSFTVNLISPYGTPECIFLHCIMPIMRIIALGMPRQTSANSFTSPFLVKVFAKGWFSCEMGMIDSISIEKVRESWSVCGLPTEFKVSFSVRDLYTNLMMTPSTRPDLYFNNQSLIEFLVTTCGVDITKPALGMKIDTLVSSIANIAFDLPDNAANSILDGIRSAASKFVGWWKY